MDYSNQVDVDHKGRPILSARRRQLKADAIALKAKVKSLLEHAHTLDLLLEKSNGQGVKGQPSQSKIAEAIGGVTNVRVSQLTRELRKEYPHIDKLFTRHMHNRRSNDKVMTERAIGEWLMDQVAEYEHVHGEYSAEWVQELATTIRDGKWGG